MGRSESSSKTQVVVRLDPEFVGALLDSDTDVPLVPDWLDHLPFDSLACSLPEPLSLHDGHDLCHYVGCLVSGIRTESPTNADASAVFTRYVPFSRAHGVRFLWLFTVDGDPSSRGQTISVPLRGHFAHPNTTLRELIDLQKLVTTEHDLPWGAELDTLIPLSVQVLLYLAAEEPDMQWIPSAQMSRPQQLQTAKVANVGWRVGSAIRAYRKETPTGGTRVVASPSGWRLPPHIRRAHWHRVRVATRDAGGRIIGSKDGRLGVDWNYQMRWYPPTLVNVSTDTPPAPTVRDVN